MFIQRQISQMMHKQNKGSDFSPCKLGKFGAVNHSDVTNLSLQACQDKLCPPQSSTGKWVVLWRELGRNTVGEKSVVEGIGVGYREDLQWAKKSTPPVRGGF